MNFSRCVKEWEQLRVLESPIMSKRYLEELDGGHDVMNSFALSAYISQARHFFESARDSASVIKPLLLYYGMIQFVKAYILVRLPNRAMRAESQKHGLAIPRRKHPLPYWKQIIWTQPNGVFVEWLRATGALATEAAHAHFANKQPMPIGDLWSCLPEAVPLLPALGLTARCTRTAIYGAQETNRSLSMQVARSWPANCGLTIEECEKRIASQLPDQCLVHFDWLSEQHELTKLDKSNPSPLLLAHHPLLCLPRVSGQWLMISPLPLPLLEEVSLPEPMIHFALLFQLSMMLRYEGEAWAELLGDGHTIEAILVERLCDLVEETTPAYFADALHI
ncbi:MAG: YaaC family protein [Firmicutes bacterium]|nr:YaaC family protein [Bacillota bacterium]